MTYKSFRLIYMIYVKINFNVVNFGKMLMTNQITI